MAGAWDRASQSGDTYYLDSAALNLHGLFDAIDRAAAENKMANRQVAQEGLLMGDPKTYSF